MRGSGARNRQGSTGTCTAVLKLRSIFFGSEFLTFIGTGYIHLVLISKPNLFTDMPSFNWLALHDKIRYDTGSISALIQKRVVDNELGK
jgi:hypothetical protein